MLFVRSDASHQTFQFGKLVHATTMMIPWLCVGLVDGSSKAEDAFETKYILNEDHGSLPELTYSALRLVFVDAS